MIVLAVETSCDETSVSVLDANLVDGRHVFDVRSNVVSSQADIHAQYGGVVPEVAARKHAENFMGVYASALAQARVSVKDISLCVVTRGPGLVTSLLVGVTSAKVFSYIQKLPLVPVNHIKGHIYASFITDCREGKEIFPALALVVSGGHTEIVLMKGFEKFKKIGQTLDDAAGEAFDKIAKMLDLGYPGGPIISRYAEKGQADKYKFPRPMLDKNNYDFSFAGLKTSVLYFLREQKKAGVVFTEEFKQNVCASVQQAIIDCLVIKTIRVAKKFKVKTVILGGGVSANKALRTQMETSVAKDLSCVAFMVPKFEYCTDNAAMIGTAGYFQYVYTKNKDSFNKTWKNITLDPTLDII